MSSYLLDTTLVCQSVRFNSHVICPHSSTNLWAGARGAAPIQELDSLPTEAAASGLAVGRSCHPPERSEWRRAPGLPPEGETEKGANPIPCCRRRSSSGGARSFLLERVALGVEPSDHVRSPALRHRLIQVLVNGDGGARERGAETALV